MPNAWHLVRNPHEGDDTEILCDVNCCNSLPKGHSWEYIKDAYTIKEEQQCKKCYSNPKLPLLLLDTHNCYIENKHFFMWNYKTIILDNTKICI
jgi:hypothetical protein